MRKTWYQKLSFVLAFSLLVSCIPVTGYAQEKTTSEKKETVNRAMSVSDPAVTITDPAITVTPDPDPAPTPTPTAEPVSSGAIDGEFYTIDENGVFTFKDSVKVRYYNNEDDYGYHEELSESFADKKDWMETEIGKKFREDKKYIKKIDLTDFAERIDDEAILDETDDERIRSIRETVAGYLKNMLRPSLVDSKYSDSSADIVVPGKEIDSTLGSIYQAKFSARHTYRVPSDNLDAFSGLEGFFENCTNLETVVIPEKMPITFRMFANCPNLKNVDIQRRDGYLYDPYDNAFNVSSHADKDLLDDYTFGAHDKEGHTRNIAAYHTVTSRDDCECIENDYGDCFAPFYNSSIAHITTTHFKPYLFANTKSKAEVKTVIESEATYIGKKTFYHASMDCSLTGLTDADSGAFAYSNGFSLDFSEPRGFTSNTDSSTFYSPFIGGNFSTVKIKGIEEDGRKRLTYFSFAKASVNKLELSQIDIIGNYAFYGSAIHMDTPANISIIEDNAFCYAKMDTQPFQSGVISNIGKDAFSHANLDTVCVSGSSVTIEKGAFCSSKVKNINLTGSNMSIGIGAFKECHEIESCILPDDVTTIPEDCFRESGIKGLDIPDSVSKINKNAFAYSDLTTLTISGPGVTVGESVFQYCEDLETVNLTGSNMTLGSDMFYHCHGLQSCKLPNDLTSIPTGCLKQTSLPTIQIPKTVTSIGSHAFLNSKLSDLSFEDDSQISSVGLNAFSQTYLTSFNVPSGTSRSLVIEASFTNCDKLKMVDLTPHGNIKSVTCNYAFANSAVENVLLPDHAALSVSLALNGTFFNCRNLKNVMSKTTDDPYYSLNMGLMPQNVSYYGPAVKRGTFENCTALENVTFDAYVTFGENAFKGCSHLSNLTMKKSETTPDTPVYQFPYANAFDGCNQAVLNQLTLNNTPIINYGVFNNMYINKLTITPTTNMPITLYDNAFTNCLNTDNPIKLPYRTNLVKVSPIANSSYRGKGAYIVTTPTEEEAARGGSFLYDKMKATPSDYNDGYIFFDTDFVESISATVSGSALSIDNTESMKELLDVSGKTSANTRKDITEYSLELETYDGVKKEAIYTITYANKANTTLNSRGNGEGIYNFVSTKVRIPITNSVTGIEIIELNKNEITFTNSDDSEDLTYTTNDTPLSKDVYWTSHNNNVARVNQEGDVIPVGNGETDIYCYSKRNKSIFAKCHVIVNIPKEEEVSIDEDLSDFIGTEDKVTNMTKQYELDKYKDNNDLFNTTSQYNPCDKTEIPVYSENTCYSYYLVEAVDNQRNVISGSAIDCSVVAKNSYGDVASMIRDDAPNGSAANNSSSCRYYLIFDRGNTDVKGYKVTLFNPKTKEKASSIYWHGLTNTNVGFDEALYYNTDSDLTDYIFAPRYNSQNPVIYCQKTGIIDLNPYINDTYTDKTGNVTECAITVSGDTDLFEYDTETHTVAVSDAAIEAETSKHITVTFSDTDSNTLSKFEIYYSPVQKHYNNTVTYGNVVMSEDGSVTNGYYVISGGAITYTQRAIDECEANTNLLKIPYELGFGCKVKKITIPEGITKLPEYCFSNFSSSYGQITNKKCQKKTPLMVEVSLPETLKELPAHIFEGTGIESLHTDSDTLTLNSLVFAEDYYNHIDLRNCTITVKGALFSYAALGNIQIDFSKVIFPESYNTFVERVSAPNWDVVIDTDASTIARDPFYESSVHSLTFRNCPNLENFGTIYGVSAKKVEFVNTPKIRQLPENGKFENGIIEEIVFHDSLISLSHSSGDYPLYHISGLSKLDLGGCKFVGDYVFWVINPANSGDWEFDCTGRPVCSSKTLQALDMSKVEYLSGKCLYYGSSDNCNMAIENVIKPKELKYLTCGYTLNLSMSANNYCGSNDYYGSVFDGLTFKEWYGSSLYDSLKELGNNVLSSEMLDMFENGTFFKEENLKNYYSFENRPDNITSGGCTYFILPDTEQTKADYLVTSERLNGNTYLYYTEDEIIKKIQVDEKELESEDEIRLIMSNKTVLLQNLGLTGTDINGDTHEISLDNAEITSMKYDERHGKLTGTVEYINIPRNFPFDTKSYNWHTYYNAEGSPLKNTILKPMSIPFCFDDVYFEDMSYAVNGITLDKHEQTIEGVNPSNDTFQLTATLSPKNVDFNEVLWTSSDPSVATVDNHGEVTVVGRGDADITVMSLDGGYTDTCEVHSVEYVTNIAVSGPSVAIKGTSVDFEADVSGTTNISHNVVWTVSGAAVTGTAISAEGVLTVAEEETADTLDVTATSVEDNTFHTTKKVEVLDYISGVAVTGPAVVLKDSTTQYKAEVTGSNEADKSVNWSITNNESDNTTIDTKGILTIGKDETTDHVIVTATSKMDGTKSDSVSVSIRDYVDKVEIVGPDSVDAGTKTSYTAKVTGSNEADKSVTWEIVTPGNTPDVVIKDDGTLEVDEKTPTKTITIQATSTFDTGKSATKKVTVKEKQKQSDISIPTVTPSPKPSVAPNKPLTLKEEKKLVKRTKVPKLNTSKIINKGSTFYVNLYGIKKSCKTYWENSNKKVVSLKKSNKRGSLTAKKNGTSVITCKVFDRSKKKVIYGFKLKVIVQTSKFKTLNTSKIIKTKTPLFEMDKTLKIGKKFKLGATECNGKVTFHSANKKIATVSKNGIVKAKKKGFAYITMKVKQNGILYRYKFHFKCEK